MIAMPTMSQLREGAHALIAVLGVIATSGALILGLLASVGVHGVDAQVAEVTGICGGAAVLFSKLIDSANNAVTSSNSAAVQTYAVPPVVASGSPPVA